jgi:ATPase subunit of ABC transporter with duplicated ATPase domains
MGKTEERDEVNIRSFLGKMIFSGEEALKTCRVLSGGEKSTLHVVSNDDGKRKCINDR